MLAAVGWPIMSFQDPLNIEGSHRGLAASIPWEGCTVEVAIPKSLEALVRRKVEEGHYSTEEEVGVEARSAQGRP